MTPDFQQFVGRSPLMLKLYQRIRKYARITEPIVIEGETGTGKELCARAIWQLAAPNRRFVPVNCGGITESLINSELFGHVRGAFTGAVNERKGLVAQAHEGILFLDELAELSLKVQKRLLRTMDRGEFRRLGSERIVRSDFRVMAATQRPLDELVRDKRLREDFGFRLGSIRIRVPPLRHRKEDIPLLTEYFLAQYRRDSGREKPKRCSEAALEVLELREWPGNVRQLQNVVSAAAGCTRGEEVRPDAVLEILSVSGCAAQDSAEFRSLNEVTGQAAKRHILRALERTAGNKLQAAELLGIHESTLHRKLRQLRDRFGPTTRDSARAAAS